MFTNPARERIFTDIHKERERQEQLKADGRFRHTCADAEMSVGDKVCCLGEEYGEVCGAVMQENGAASDRVGAETRKELLHVIAVAVAWVEAIDKQAEQTMVNVYVRPECLFNYCPSPESCRDGDMCVSPLKR